MNCINPARAHGSRSSAELVTRRPRPQSYHARTRPRTRTRRYVQPEAQVLRPRCGCRGHRHVLRDFGCAHSRGRRGRPTRGLRPGRRPPFCWPHRELLAVNVPDIEDGLRPSVYFVFVI